MTGRGNIRTTNVSLRKHAPPPEVEEAAAAFLCARRLKEARAEKEPPFPSKRRREAERVDFCSGRDRSSKSETTKPKTHTSGDQRLRTCRYKLSKCIGL